jgi:hypothetical protein
MFNIYRKKSERYSRYKSLFESWERHLLTHPDDVLAMSMMATQRAIVTFDPVAQKYGIPTKHDPETLIARVEPKDLYDMSETCLGTAREYKNQSERFYQGAVLAGLYFGVAGLIAEKESRARGLWRHVNSAMSRSIELAARSTERQRPNTSDDALGEKPLHQHTRVETH